MAGFAKHVAARISRRPGGDDACRARLNSRRLNALAGLDEHWQFGFALGPAFLERNGPDAVVVIVGPFLGFYYTQCLGNFYNVVMLPTSNTVPRWCRSSFTRPLISSGA